MFPKHKRTWYGKKPDGWEDLVEEVDRKFWSAEHQRNMGECTTHDVCGQKAYIGREDGKLFKFCPRCMVKVGESKRPEVAVGDIKYREDPGKPLKKPTIGQKRCTKCQNYYPWTSEYFRKTYKPESRAGLNPSCKKCTNKPAKVSQQKYRDRRKKKV